MRNAVGRKCCSQHVCLNVTEYNTPPAQLHPLFQHDWSALLFNLTRIYSILMPAIEFISFQLLERRANTGDANFAARARFNGFSQLSFRRDASFDKYLPELVNGANGRQLRVIREDGLRVDQREGRGLRGQRVRR